MSKEVTISISEVQKLLQQGKSVKVNTPDGYQLITEFIEKGTAPIYEVSFKNELKLECTLEHKIDTKDRGMVRLKDIQFGEEILTEYGFSPMYRKKFLRIDKVCDISVNHENHRFYGNHISVSNSYKGLEHKVSIICGFTSFRPKKDIHNDLANMLYVQGSRAMDKLCVINSFNYVAEEFKTSNGYIDDNVSALKVKFKHRK